MGREQIVMVRSVGMKNFVMEKDLLRQERGATLEKPAATAPAFLSSLLLPQVAQFTAKFDGINRLSACYTQLLHKALASIRNLHRSFVFYPQIRSF